VITEVAAALIQDSAGRYLITRRREGTHLAGLWEFPGGKCHAGETFEACLRRELGEELGGSFTVGEKVETVRWEYPAATVVIHFFRCRLVAGQVEPSPRPSPGSRPSSSRTTSSPPPTPR